MTPPSGPQRASPKLTVTVAILLACRCFYAGPAIPSTVSDEEYAVYAAWLTRHFKEQPQRLFIQSETFIFDPSEAGTCTARQLEQVAHIDPALILALHQLGEAKYPLRTGKFAAQPFKIPWKFEESDGLIANPPPPFRLISFSRVAFNEKRTQALFAVSDACGGLCGGGAAVLATRNNDGWIFNGSIGCNWVY